MPTGLLDVCTRRLLVGYGAAHGRSICERRFDSINGSSTAIFRGASSAAKHHQTGFDPEIEYLGSLFL
jgi:hypothetical protein